MGESSAGFSLRPKLSQRIRELYGHPPHHGVRGDRLLESLSVLGARLRLGSAGLAVVDSPSRASLAFATIDPMRLLRVVPAGLAFLASAPSPFVPFESLSTTPFGAISSISSSRNAACQ